MELVVILLPHWFLGFLTGLGLFDFALLLFDSLFQIHEVVQNILAVELQHFLLGDAVLAPVVLDERSIQLGARFCTLVLAMDVVENVSGVLYLEFGLFPSFLCADGGEVQGESIIKFGDWILQRDVLLHLIVVDAVRPGCLGVVEEVDEIDGVGQERRVRFLVPPPSSHPLLLYQMQLLQLLLL